jgi:hypothetical protein
MTPLRKLATQISATVVRLSSPGAKDWAQASAQELASIQNDWAALRWSLGSTRLLLHRQEQPLAGLSSVPAAAEKLAQRTALRARAMCIVAAGDTAGTIQFLAVGHHPSHPLVYYLFIAALVFMALQTLARRGRGLQPDADLRAQVAQYRSQLQREREYHSGLWLWSRFVALYAAVGIFIFRIKLIATAPPASVHHAVVRGVVIVVALAIVSVAGNYRKAAEYRLRIVELDSIERGAS